MQISKPFILALAAIALLGAGCAWGQKPEETVTPEKTVRKLNVFDQQDRFDYVENIRIKIEDLNLHLGKLRDYRQNLVPSQQVAYDTQVNTYGQQIVDFTVKFEAFKETPLEEFLEHRLPLNEALVVVETTYFDIITKYKIDFSKQP